MSGIFSKYKHQICFFLFGISVVLSIWIHFDFFSVPVFAPHNDQAILVLDAGHGGIDGGAVSESGICEQTINLAIAKKCEAFAGLFGIRTMLTRKDEQSIDYQADQSIRQNKIADIHGRENIVKSIPNPIFLSIHLNKFTDPSYAGAQVFWSKHNAESSLLAVELQQALTDGLSPGKQRKAKQAADSIYLMKVLRCPAVIVECGFLSNAAEAEKLAQDSYQKQLTLCIIGGYLNYMEQSS